METIPKKNRKIIKEVWNGEHSSEDFCGTCKSSGEDVHYLRYCNKYNFSSYPMKIFNCIGYEENKGVNSDSKNKR